VTRLRVRGRRYRACGVISSLTSRLSRPRVFFRWFAIGRSSLTVRGEARLGGGIAHRGSRTNALNLHANAMVRRPFSIFEVLKSPRPPSEAAFRPGRCRCYEGAGSTRSTALAGAEIGAESKLTRAAVGVPYVGLFHLRRQADSVGLHLQSQPRSA
jgi:hypothetical protein